MPGRCCGNGMLMQRPTWQSSDYSGCAHLHCINCPLALSGCCTPHQVLARCTAPREDSGAASASRGGETRQCGASHPASLVAQLIVLQRSSS